MTAPRQRRMQSAVSFCPLTERYAATAVCLLVPLPYVTQIIVPCACVPVPCVTQLDMSGGSVPLLRLPPIVMPGSQCMHMSQVEQSKARGM